MRLILLLSVASMLIISACNTRDDYQSVPEKTVGYEPVYVDSGIFIQSIVGALPTRILKADEIILEGKFMFILEKGRGIHVLDKSDTTKEPIALSFIEAAYTQHIETTNTDLMLQNAIGIIYLNLTDLPAVKVNQFVTRKDVNEVPNFVSSYGTLATGRVYFECITEDPKWLIAWREKGLEKPNCFKDVTR